MKPAKLQTIHWSPVECLNLSRTVNQHIVSLSRRILVLIYYNNGYTQHN